MLTHFPFKEGVKTFIQHSIKMTKPFVSDEKWPGSNFPSPFCIGENLENDA